MPEIMNTPWRVYRHRPVMYNTKGNREKDLFSFAVPTVVNYSALSSIAS